MLRDEVEDLLGFIKSKRDEIGLTKERIEAITIEITKTFRFTFPSDTSQLSLIRLVSSKVVSLVPNFDEDNLDDIGLAIDEACTNVIIHSYNGGESGDIIVEYKIAADRVTITIIDEGEKGQNFNPDELSAVDKEEYLNTLSRGGLGVHIIKKIMDEVEYIVAPGSHNCLKMVKFAK